MQCMCAGDGYQSLQVSLISYLIQTKKAGGDWVTTVVDKNKADSRHGLGDWIDYRLSADQLKNCHSGLDETQLAACRQASASGKYEVQIRVRTAVGAGAQRRDVDGPHSVPVVATVGSGAGRPGPVTDGRVDHIGTGGLRVSWDAPETRPENVYGYRVQWKARNTPGSTWQSRNIYPRQNFRDCSYASGCSNPRSVDLWGLTSGQRYSITVSALGADGMGTTIYIGFGWAPD